jgi:hypothetical protein
VYRLSEWGARKYNPPLPEADQGENDDFPGLGTQNHDCDAAFTSSQGSWVQGMHPSPVIDVQQQWLAKMKLRADFQVVLPRNTAAFSGYNGLYNSLYNAMTPKCEATPLHGAIVDACVFSALADHIDPDDKTRIDTIIAGLRRNTPSRGGVDELRRRLQLHALGADPEGSAFRTMAMIEDIIMNRQIKSDLNMFFLLVLFGSCHGPGVNAAKYEERIMRRYVQCLEEDQEAQSVMREGIKWCKSICDGPKDIDLRLESLDVDPSNSNESIQLNMAKASCLLFDKLLRDDEEQPRWAQNIEGSLGISKTTFAATLVCMAFHRSEDCSSPDFPLSPHDRVYLGLGMLTTISPSAEWRMLLNAFVQVHRTAFTGHDYTFPLSMDQSPCSDDFIKNLYKAVSDFIEDIQPSELGDSPSSYGQVGSVFGDPLTPLQSADDNYYTQHMGASLEDDGDYVGFYFPNTFQDGKDIGSLPLFAAANDTSMDLGHHQAPYMSSQ